MSRACNASGSPSPAPRRPETRARPRPSGDPVFSNAILTRDGQVKLIDMRGSLGERVTTQGDRHYDLSKVYQSLCGYDFMLLDRRIAEGTAHALAQLRDVFWQHVRCARAAARRAARAPSAAGARPPPLTPPRARANSGRPRVRPQEKLPADGGARHPPAHRRALLLDRAAARGARTSGALPARLRVDARRRGAPLRAPKPVSGAALRMHSEVPTSAKVVRGPQAAAEARVRARCTGMPKERVSPVIVVVVVVCRLIFICRLILSKLRPV